MKYLRTPGLITISTEIGMVTKPCNDEQFAELKPKLDNDEVEEVMQFIDPEIAEGIAMSNKLGTLEGDDRFYTDGECWYRKGIPLSLPRNLVDRFTYAIESDDIALFRAVDNFWFRCSQNPNANSREQLYAFLEQNKIHLTPTGLMICFRWICNTDTVLEGFNGTPNMSSIREQVKRKKKSASNLRITEDFKVTESKKKGLMKFTKFLTMFSKNKVYTDQYSRSMRIEMGRPVNLDRAECDFNTSNACSSGLHVAGLDWAKRNSFGDVRVVTLVDPSLIVSVPNYDAGKMRACEYYPCYVVDSWDGIVEDKLELAEYERNYIKILNKRINSILTNPQELERHIHLIKKRFLEERVDEIKKELKTRLK